MRWFPLFLGLTGLLSVCVLVPRTLAAPRSDHYEAELVVQLRPAYSRTHAAVESTLRRALSAYGVRSVETFMTDSSLQKIRIARDSELSQAIAALKAQTSVVSVEPNFRYHALDVVNDPDFPKTWGMRNVGQVDAAGQPGTPGADVHVTQLWQKGYTGDRRIVVAVIDTGIDWDHPDLKDNLYTNPSLAPHDGFVGDIHGYNFVDHNPDSRDDHNHGTHCAGTIGAIGNNGIGVAGVNWQVSLMPVKFLDKNGAGSLEGAIEAINYARLMKVNVMSNSWGGAAYSDLLEKAIQAARDAGILFVVAAGNDSSDNDATPSYPAAYKTENVLTVAATDNQDRLAPFSSFGRETVHVAAPGVKIYSTVKDGKYDVLSGTSMACPHVSGIAALLMAHNPGMGYAEIRERLIKTSDYVPLLRRKSLSHGRVDAYNAFYNVLSSVPPDPAESDWKVAPGVSVESVHPYANNLNQKYVVHVPGAKLVRVHFDRVNVELKYDQVTFETPAGDAIETLTGGVANVTTDYVTGDTAVIRLKTDYSGTDWGFKADQVQYVPVDSARLTIGRRSD